eukprot:233211_1
MDINMHTSVTFVFILDPMTQMIGFLPVEDKPFALFKQLQQINIQMQNLQHHIRTVSTPALQQINAQLLQLNYISNPTHYFQLQQQQSVLFHTVQQQQQQHRTLKQKAHKIQNAYQKARNPDHPTSETSPQHKPIHLPKPPSLQATDSSKSTVLSMIIEHDSEINDDVTSTESAEYQLTSSMADTIPEGTANELLNEMNQNAADDHTTPLCMNDGEAHKYSITDLISFEPQFVHINWCQHEEIPLDIRFIDHRTFMDDMLAVISRRCVDRFSDRHEKMCSDDTKRKTMKKLKGILNKMTPTKFAKIAKQTMDIILVYAQTKDEMEDILRLILEFGTRQSVFSEEYAKLIEHVFGYLPRLRMICEYDWIVSDDELSKTFRNMVIIECQSLFDVYINHSVIDMDDSPDEEEEYDVELLEVRKAKQKKTFINFLKLCGDLYNVNMIKMGVIYKGIIDELLPPKNDHVSAIDIEGICALFKQCGDKLDEENALRVDVYLNRVKQLANGFGFRTKCLVDGIREMRLKDWTHRIQKEKPKELDVLKKEFDEEQQKQSQKRTHERRSRSTSKRRDKSRYYEYDSYKPRRSHSEHARKRRAKAKRYRQEEDDYYYGNGYDGDEYRGYERRDASYNHSRSHQHRSYGDYY